MKLFTAVFLAVCCTANLSWAGWSAQGYASEEACETAMAGSRLAKRQRDPGAWAKAQCAEAATPAATVTRTTPRTGGGAPKKGQFTAEEEATIRRFLGLVAGGDESDGDPAGLEDVEEVLKSIPLPSSVKLLTGQSAELFRQKLAEDFWGAAKWVAFWVSVGLAGVICLIIFSVRRKSLRREIEAELRTELDRRLDRVERAVEDLADANDGGAA